MIWSMPLLALICSSVAAAGLVGRLVPPPHATGAAPVFAFAVIGAGALVVAVLSLLLDHHAVLAIDSSVAQWGQDEASSWSTEVIRVITYLGDIRTVAVLAVIVVVATALRQRDRADLSSAIFLVVVLAGNNALHNVLKQLANRPRPAFDESTASLGPSFPSGHSATAAAGYAAIALLLARHDSPRVRAWYAAAAAVAVAVAASRVLLGFHWLSDAICGLALGWAWCAVVRIALGGRLRSEPAEQSART